MDDDAHEQADNLLALLLAQSRIQAGAEGRQRVHGHLRGTRGCLGRQGRHTGLQFGLLTCNASKLDVELCGAELAPDAKRQSPAALLLEAVQRSCEGHGLGGGDGALGVAFAPTIELVEDVARVPQPAFDVGPDQGLDRVGPDGLTPAPAGEGPRSTICPVQRYQPTSPRPWVPQ